MGIVGLETAFPVLYTDLVRPGILSLEQVVVALTLAPNARFGIGTNLEIGQPADFCMYDLCASYIVNPDEFLSMGRATPFAGRTVYGRCKMTVCVGNVFWREL